MIKRIFFIFCLIFLTGCVVVDNNSAQEKSVEITSLTNSEEDKSSSLEMKSDLWERIRENLTFTLPKDFIEADTYRKRFKNNQHAVNRISKSCLLYTSPSPRDKRQSRMPSSA